MGEGVTKGGGSGIGSDEAEGKHLMLSGTKLVGCVLASRLEGSVCPSIHLLLVFFKGMLGRYLPFTPVAGNKLAHLHALKHTQTKAVP